MGEDLLAAMKTPISKKTDPVLDAPGVHLATYLVH